ncbi:MAG: Demethylmenaquinone methyltransferase [Planctomycetes bacterium ADurb.Bin069]|nr:MAG: Demethylmenaquinone methyltransferase [Planctomycetes bacterium ADurb.Bin069]
MGNPDLDTGGSDRARSIRAMFGRIARRYDRMNAIITFGRDRAWIRAPCGTAGRVLDVATGTGVLAEEVLRLAPRATVVGIDFAIPMIRAGMAARKALPLRWCLADALALPFPDDCFDAVLSAFLLRNAVSLERAIAEQARVVRPGGRVVCLESSPRRPGPLRPLARWYMRRVIPFAAALLAGDAPAYRYLADSTAAFLPPESLARAIEGAGLRLLSVRTFMAGTVALHTAAKPGEAPRP